MSVGALRFVHLACASFGFFAAVVPLHPEVYQRPARTYLASPPSWKAAKSEKDPEEGLCGYPKRTSPTCSGEDLEPPRFSSNQEGPCPSARKDAAMVMSLRIQESPTDRMVYSVSEALFTGILGLLPTFPFQGTEWWQGEERSQNECKHASIRSNGSWRATLAQDNSLEKVSTGGSRENSQSSSSSSSATGTCRGRATVRRSGRAAAPSGAIQRLHSPRAECGLGSSLQDQNNNSGAFTHSWTPNGVPTRRV